VKHYKLLCDFGELSWIFNETYDIGSFLQKIVSIVSRHIQIDAAAIYLYDEETDELQLKAVEGLPFEEIQKEKIEIGKGLTGQALKERRTVCIRDIDEVKDKGYAPHFASKTYHSYLSVPILRGITPIGVLNLCREEKNGFTNQDIQVLQVITSQLANIIENANLFLKLAHEKKYPERFKPRDFIVPTFIKGQSASGGFARGYVKVLRKEKSITRLLDSGIEDDYSVNDFIKALKITEKQLNEMQHEIEKTLDDAASLIFTSHLLMLKDKFFLDEIHALIDKGEPPAIALLKIAKKYIIIFSQSPNAYIREKVLDVEDLTLRILDNMGKGKNKQKPLKDKIIIAKELFPSDILKLSTENVAGIIQVAGGITSHVSILARSFEIPLVIADRPDLMDLKQDNYVLINAEQGDVYINPSKEMEDNFNHLIAVFKRYHIEKEKIKKETHTRDGVRIKLLANINLLRDLRQALSVKAEGVGLYRTEFPFLIRNDFPSEEEQYVIYKKIIDEVGDKVVNFRTLDIGGDKIHSYYEDFHESNPFLGMRSIRFSLHNVDIFRQQLRAILRACSPNIQARIMFPMISALDEFRKAKDLLMDCTNELKKEGYTFQFKPLVGIMIELPAAVEILDELCREADFFSIGTNDLIQYVLGVDRTNEKVADFYLPHHPAILRCLKRITDTCKVKNKELTLCGEMAHHQRYIPFLLGIGIRSLSMDSLYIGKIQMFISNLLLSKAQDLAEKLLKKVTTADLAELMGFY
jgi:phosphotransferase system enzyme I (PtsP)